MEGVELPRHGYIMGSRIPVLRNRDAMAGGNSEAGVEPPSRIVARQPTTTSASSAATTSCAPGDDSGLCQKPVGSSSMTLPIILGVAIPLGAAIIVLIYLHRRSVRKVKQEDAMDPHKSLDFGMGERSNKLSKASRKSQRGEKDPNRYRQLSMDMNLSSPYLLPPGLQSSRESLHSLARTLHQSEDPYRPVAQYAASDAASLHSVQKGREGSSVYTGSSGGQESAMPHRPLASPGLPAAPRQNSLPTSPSPPEPVHKKPKSLELEINTPAPVLPSGDPFPGPHEPTVPHLDSTPYPESSHDMLGQAISGTHVVQEPPPIAQQIPRKGLPATPRKEEAREPVSSALPDDEHWDEATRNERYHSQDSFGAGLGLLDSRPPEQSTIHMSPPPADAFPPEPHQHSFSPPISAPIIEEPQEYYDYEYPTTHQESLNEFGYDERGRSRYRESANYQQNNLNVPQQDMKRLSVGFRPLPPDDFMESDDPEVRANRIRSFYKEYFDDSREPMPMPPQHGGANYYEDYDATFAGDATYFDPEANAFVMPYAQPVARRAMTPPPSGSRFPGPRGPRNFHGSIGGMSLPGGRGVPRPGSSASNRYGPRPGSSASNRPGPRAGSSMSGRWGAPRKPMPPPSALTTLPNPSKLRDDSFALMGSIDFAPPESYADRAAGRAQSPAGERRPYQLKAPIHSPLVNAFDELSALPSPHLLRKSGTFTALDFAPPRKFTESDSRSETGSIRSNRSGISAVQLGAIRSGAGRVSRLPGDTIFTQAQLSQKLKPAWSMRD